jgi:hypothetical protein
MRDRKSRADAPITIDSPTNPKIEGWMVERVGFELAGDFLSRQ